MLSHLVESIVNLELFCREKCLFDRVAIQVHQVDLFCPKFDALLNVTDLFFCLTACLGDRFLIVADQLDLLQHRVESLLPVLPT